ncbi:hypothetical protein PCANC_16206 [Puccinia coronata f. sp. avenae]|uniref:Uncharacterized protein n=1 Tax=Puccinia coronata f. sp. avenae TaxID=200324 RepID=A0A2N5UF50_9BASI|nr:hypothetical protein PCANC_16206 [Puccinia coronata f. sp. avenae]
MRSRLASWPTTKERLESSQVMQEEGFPGCVGFVNGTNILLSQKPPIDGNHYFDCNKRCKKLARMAASEFLSDAAIRFKLGRAPPSELLTHSNSAARAFGHQV